MISTATFVTSGAPCRTLAELVGCPATVTLSLLGVWAFLVVCSTTGTSFVSEVHFYSVRIMFTLALFSAPVNTFICACAASFALETSIARSNASSESLSNLSFILESLKPTTTRISIRQSCSDQNSHDYDFCGKTIYRLIFTLYSGVKETRIARNHYFRGTQNSVNFLTTVLNCSAVSAGTAG